MTKRNSAIELLRIISIVMIVAHHFSLHGGFTFPDNAHNMIASFWYYLLLMGGKIGVNVFVLISAYFLIGSKSSLSISKIVKLWGQVIFYAWGISLISMICHYDQLTIKLFIKSLFPITFSFWWFATTYFILYLLHPFLNKGLNQLDKRNYQRLLFILFGVWSLLPTITTAKLGGGDLTWFLNLYCLGGYIRNYGFPAYMTRKRWALLAAIVAIGTYGVTLALSLLGQHLNMAILSSHATFFYGQNKVPIVIISVALLMIALNSNINYSKRINQIASASFGVYLIHDNPLVRHFLWIDFLKVAKYQNTLLIIPMSIVIILGVYVICTLIELTRQALIEKPMMKVVNRKLTANR